jgi:hypothetical protein
MTQAACSTCGNTYDKAFNVVTSGGDGFVFDSIECAAARLAPECAQCGCRILGHGMESAGAIYCCAHCARQDGVDALEDRA